MTKALVINPLSSYMGTRLEVVATEPGYVFLRRPGHPRDNLRFKVTEVEIKAAARTKRAAEGGTAK